MTLFGKSGMAWKSGKAIYTILHLSTFLEQSNSKGLRREITTSPLPMGAIICMLHESNFTMWDFIKINGANLVLFYNTGVMLLLGYKLLPFREPPSNQKALTHVYCSFKMWKFNNANKRHLTWFSSSMGLEPKTAFQFESWVDNWLLLYVYPKTDFTGIHVAGWMTLLYKHHNGHKDVNDIKEKMSELTIKFIDIPMGIHTNR